MTGRLGKIQVDLTAVGCWKFAVEYRQDRSHRWKRNRMFPRTDCPRIVTPENSQRLPATKAAAGRLE